MIEFLYIGEICYLYRLEMSMMRIWGGIGTYSQLEISYNRRYYFRYGCQFNIVAKLKIVLSTTTKSYIFFNDLDINNQKYTIS